MRIDASVNGLRVSPSMHEFLLPNCPGHPNLKKFRSMGKVVDTADCVALRVLDA